MSGEARRRRLRGLIRLAGVRKAGDLAVVEQAFVHESHAKERGGTSNERLEFLGDSVLSLVTAQWLFERYHDEAEGLLTLRRAAIVNDARLADAARRLGFPDVVVLGAGMRASGGTDNTTILAGAFEAFVAALYLAYGIEKARTFVIAEHLERSDQPASELIDPKTRLQHYAQEHLAATPVYHERSRGTPQQPAFSSRVSVNGRTLGTGRGSSKKAAQQAAAEAALVSLRT
ncbi:MAG TPA: ribonuclease III [Candidatus Tumulicola sp.]